MDRETALAAIAAYERTIRVGPLTRLVRRAGTTAWFAAVYRRVGPVVDPRIARVRDGELLARVYGFPTLLLASTGAKSGQPRVSPLLYVRAGDDFVVVGTNFGQPRHPAWTANLLADPEAEVMIGGIVLPVRAGLMSDAERELHFPGFVAIYPGYANYLDRRGGLPPRMFRLVATED